MLKGRRKHDGLLTAHLKAAVIGAAGGKPNLETLNPFGTDVEAKQTMKPGEYWKHRHGQRKKRSDSSGPGVR